MRLHDFWTVVRNFIPHHARGAFDEAVGSMPDWFRDAVKAVYEREADVRDILEARIARALHLCDLVEKTQGRIASNGNLACVPVAAVRSQLGGEAFPELPPRASHEQFMAVYRKLPSDYEPWGVRSDDERGGDCSCGCVWFHEVDGALGADWGVCFNPASPRAGLLTFEHQGCPQYDGGPDEEEDDE